MKWVGMDTACLVGKGMAILCSGECIESFPEMAFIEISMCRGIQHTCIAHWSMSKGYGYRKHTLSIDSNWRNTEICLRSGSVRHADARWLLRHVSWDKEFTPYALNLNIYLYQQGYTKQSKLQRIQCILQAWFPMGPLGASIRLCLPPAFQVFQSSLTGLFQGLACIRLQSLIPHKVVPNTLSLLSMAVQ